MEPVEPPLRKRKVEETTVLDDVVSCSFLTNEEWSAAVNNQGNYSPPSGWTDEDDDEVDPALEQEFYRQIRESDVYVLNLFLCNFGNFSRNDCVSE